MFELVLTASARNLYYSAVNVKGNVGFCRVTERIDELLARL